MAPVNPSVRFILDSFRKHSIEEDNLFDLKHEQENTVHCVSEQMDVFAAISTEYNKRLTFQLFAAADMIKKFRDGQHSDTVLLVTRITSIQFTFR